MRSEKSLATAVRNEDGDILVESSRHESLKDKNILYKIPILRGIIVFFASMVSGMKIMIRSTEVFVQEEEMEEKESKLSAWLSKTFNISALDLAIFFGVLVGILLGIALFILLPLGTTRLLEKYTSFSSVHVTVKNIVEGVIRLAIFIIYLVIISQMKDIKRILMYHGAEHKTINCFENGLEMTVENVKKQSRIHDRCGTSFLFIVMFISIFIISLTGDIKNFGLKLGVRILLMPVIAGISYEILKFLARFDNRFVYAIKAPGLLMQRLTTKEPDEKMVEVAIKAFTTVQKLDADPDYPLDKFDMHMPYLTARDELKSVLSKNVETEEADLDWIICEVLNIKRNELQSLDRIKESEFERMLDYANKRAEGIPFQHICGYVDFLDTRISVDRRALIPRPETEILADIVIKELKNNTYIKVLDLCTGSGCIAIATKKAVDGIQISASDISQDALDLAKENANKNQVLVDFIKSDMFDNIKDEYDVIISNPPYVKTADIENLQKEVKDHEPYLALDGGLDGLTYYKKIKDFVEKSEQVKVVFLEIGYDLLDEIKQLFNLKGYVLEAFKDFDGIERIIKITINR